MRLLVATTVGQGDHPGDFCFATDGEPVTPLLPPCTAPSRCRCGRSFDGLDSDRGTTTAMVADIPGLTRAELLMRLHDSVERHAAVPERIGIPTADDQFAEIVRIASSWPIGSIVRRDGDGRCVVQRGPEVDVA